MEQGCCKMCVQTALAVQEGQAWTHGLGPVSSEELLTCQEAQASALVSSFNGG